MSSALSISKSKSSTCCCFGKPKKPRTKTEAVAQQGPPFAQPQDISMHLARGGLPPQTFKHVRAPTGHPNHPRKDEQ
jgi:hypothetical protein